MIDGTQRTDGAWFAPKRYGYGAGLPIAWQGWALVAGFIALVVLASRLSPGWAAAVVFPALVILIEVSRRRTRGGWRWRWGRD